MKKLLRVLFVGNGKVSRLIKNKLKEISEKNNFKISFVNLKSDYFDSAIFVDPNKKQLKLAKRLSSKMNLPVLVISSKKLNVGSIDVSDYPIILFVSDLSRIEGTGIEDYIKSFLNESFGSHGKRVAYCVVKWRNKVLLVKRAEGYPIWEFPGGKVEANELPKSTAIRELQEEAGILASKVKFLGRSRVVYSNGDVRYNWLFLVETKRKPEVKLNPIEHEKYEWVEIKKLCKHRSLGLSVISFRKLLGV